MIKVMSHPHPKNLGHASDGISQVIRGYNKHLQKFGIEYVDPDCRDYDLIAAHAGAVGAQADICHCHGLYFTADYDAPDWEHATNAKVIASLRAAREVTVPSSWVAEAIARDMRFWPTVVPHGIDWDEWQEPAEDRGYVLWNKNRTGDVCDTRALDWLVESRPDVGFVSTFARAQRPNVAVTGVVPHAQMKKIVKSCGVYLSTAKETFGVGILEAMASGKPVLGFRRGGIVDLVEHGVNGYLAEPDDLDDLLEGLAYCLRHAEALGYHGREMARAWTWEAACEVVAGVYARALEPDPPTCAVIIPSYNYADFVGRALASAMAQTWPHLVDVVVVDDASPDDGATKRAVDEALRKVEARADDLHAAVEAKEGEVSAARDAAGAEEDEGRRTALHKFVAGLEGELRELRDASAVADLAASRAGIVRYVRHPENYGVAVARNTGIRETQAKYIACVDADDAMHPEFLEKLARALEDDPSLGVAYSKLHVMRGDGALYESTWPDECDFDQQVAGNNQVPTCCLFRRKAWERLGGYRARYAPEGCGTEDAELWLRMGASGWGMRLASRQPLFLYTLGGHTTGGSGYREVDYTVWHPWCADGRHPFASIAAPANGKAHPVRQVDEPTVSAIVPVGPGHEHAVVNALDSLEAQTFRGWEAVVVWDVPNVPEAILKAYPHARHVKIVDAGGEPRGAGAARNAGIEAARGPLCLPLDADDWLFPTAMEALLEAYMERSEPVAAYPDYVGLSVITDEKHVAELQKAGRLLDRDERGRTVARHYAFEYDQAEALRQPDLSSPYVWNNVTTLFPTEWWAEVGGFDEGMESWEDWDFWLRLARAGKCFVRVPEPLLVYQFYSGDRRERGRQNSRELVQYMQGKYATSGEDIVMCKGCGPKSASTTHSLMGRGNLRSRQLPATMGSAPIAPAQAVANDSDMVLCEYTSQKRGSHPLSGPHTFPNRIEGLNMKRSGNGWSIYYNYKSAGEQFYVHIKDVEAAPHWFRPVVRSEGIVNLPRARRGPVAPPPPPPVQARAPVAAPQAPPTAAPIPRQANVPIREEDLVPVGAAQSAPTVEEEAAPTPALEKAFDFQALPGVTAEIAEQFEGAGFSGPGDVVANAGALQGFRGIGPTKAEMILAAAQGLVGPPKVNEETLAREMEALLS